MDSRQGRLRNIVRVRLLQRFFAGSFILPRRRWFVRKTVIILLSYAFASALVFQLFTKERAEIYWCYELYRVGQTPCQVRHVDRWDTVSVVLYATSLLAFLGSIVPCNVLNAMTGECRQRDVASSIARKRIGENEDIKLGDILTLGGYRDSSNGDRDATVAYREAMNEEFYARFFSSFPSEIYLNWVCGNKIISVSLTVLFAVSVGAPIACFQSVFYVRVWIFVVSTTFYLAPLHALIFILPITLNPSTSNLASVTLILLTVAKLSGLVVSKSAELRHEKHLLTLFFKTHENWLKMNIDDHKFLYLLGYDGYF